MYLSPSQDPNQPQAQIVSSGDAHSRTKATGEPGAEFDRSKMTISTGPFKLEGRHPETLDPAVLMMASTTCTSRLATLEGRMTMRCKFSRYNNHSDFISLVVLSQFILAYPESHCNQQHYLKTRCKLNAHLFFV